MNDPFNRRRFLKTSLGLAAGFSLTNLACGPTDQVEPAAEPATEPSAAAAATSPARTLVLAHPFTS